MVGTGEHRLFFVCLILAWFRRHLPRGVGLPLMCTIDYTVLSRLGKLGSGTVHVGVHRDDPERTVEASWLAFLITYFNLSAT